MLFGQFINLILQLIRKTHFILFFFRMGRSITNISLANNKVFPQNLFNCEAKFLKAEHQVFHVESAFYQGRYACLFTTLDENLVLSDAIEVTVTPKAGLMPVLAEKIILPFSSVFKIVSAAPLHLTNVDPQSEIIITGL